MLPDGRRLGAHLPLGGGMVKAVERAGAIGADALQIFTDNPTAWARRAAPPVELPAFIDALATHGIDRVAIHAAYLVNLAGPDAVYRERSIDLLAAELTGAASFGARYVNVHIGSHRGDGVDVGITRIAESVTRLVAVDDPTMLVLENSAGGGWGIGVDLDELAAIAEALDRCGVPPARIGFCLDVAHAWGAGIDVGDPDTIDAFLEAFDARIGAGRLVLVHLNDSRVERGSRLDRHEHLGAGRVGVRGLRHILTHPLLRRATYLLETPGMDEGYDAINLARARAIAAGEPLEPLPDEAFELSGSSRARTAPA